ncbi:MAG: hypothetical protein NTW29_17235 [Bacteroidetes bacterium]|nr:hypothetical protein [Bacteroidota bacterium]
MIVLTIIYLILAAYLCAGFVFALFFIAKGAAMVDESAKGAGWGFRLIIIPGTMLFWPLLWMKWHSMKTKKNNQTSPNT